MSGTPPLTQQQTQKAALRLQGRVEGDANAGLLGAWSTPGAHPPDTAPRPRKLRKHTRHGACMPTKDK